jgi:3',5'-cyclic AMP phosphodiesterase CpdA
MLTLLHLSDLHFATKDADSQFDKDDEIRAAIIRDLGIDGRSNFDAMLVTGDLAYHGETKEFERAEKWFDEVRAKIQLPAESVYVIPGNHDVNRKNVGDDTMLMDAHKAIRAINDYNDRDASVAKKLKDSSYDFLGAISEYRNFAVTQDCPTSATELAWSLRLPNLLDDNTPVRLHGLNSALLSNEFDQKANLLVTEFQFHRLRIPEDCIEVVMCHHPPSWLLDGNEVDDRYRRYANLVLTGHEHQSRCFNQGPGLRVCAGAVHPARREPNWQPSYNVIRLSIESSGQQRTLVIDVETRNWHKTDLVFVAYPWSGPQGRYVHRQDLPPARIAQSQSIPNNSDVPPVTTEPAIVPEEPPTADNLAFAAGRRKLIVHFFRLAILSRYQVVISVALYDESDEALEGQARWAKVFERAEQSKKLSALWTAVASMDDSLAGEHNPFTPGT